MGYNTIAFILNDYTEELQRSPLTVTRLLTSGHHVETIHDLESAVNGEQIFNVQALRVLPPFHSSTMNFFVAGGNSIEKLEVARFGKDKGRKTITLYLPEWWSR